MVRFLALAALAVASPAMANPSQDEWLGDSYAVGRASAYDRTFLYVAGDDRRGPRIFSRDDGYFQGRGGGVLVANGQASFDYDRDYPYDFPGRWGADEMMIEDEGRDLGSEPVCTFEQVRDRRTGASAEVRICR